MENLSKFKDLRESSLLKDQKNFPQMENFFQIELKFTQKICEKIEKTINLKQTE